MLASGIHGRLLEITVVGCNKLKDMEWFFSRQDPYVCVEYGSAKIRTRTCTDGGKNPTFQEKFCFTLIEGLRELKVSVWNSNTYDYDDFIGSGKVQLQKVVSQGFDDTVWSIQRHSGRYSGEVRLIMHFPNANKPGTSFAASATPYYMAPQGPQPTVYVAVPQASPYSTYPTYPPNNPATYPPSPFHPQLHQPVAYPPQPYPPPPQPQATPYYYAPSGQFPGYPPPPPY